MSARDFIARVKVAFDSSEFRAGLSDAQKAYDKAFRGMSSAVGDFQSHGALAMQTATQLSLIAASTEQYRGRIQAALSAPSEMAADLESALAAASTVVTPELSIDGDYARTMEALRAQALAWGDGTAEGASVATASAAEYASTTYSMLSAGLQAEAAMNATSQAMILAKGTMGDTRDAADLLAMAYNTMGDKAKDSGEVLQGMADIVAKTQAAFQIANLNQLSEGLKYAIPTAQRFRIEWAEISTIIGQLNTSGLTGSQAGTSFASMMAQMLKASQSLGFDIAYDEDGGMSVIGTLRNIQEEFGNISDLAPDVQMAFDTAFGQEGSRALTLLSTALDSLSSNYEAVADSEGQAELMASRMSDTYAEKLAEMNNARSAMQARLGVSSNNIRGVFADIRTSLYNTASAFLDTDIGGFVGSIASGAMMAADGLLGIGGSALNVAAQLATFVAMAQQAGGVMGLLRSGGQMVVSLFSGIGGIITGLGSTILGVVSKIVPAVAAAGKAIGTAMYSALGPVGVVIAIIAAVASAAYLVYKNWDAIKEFFVGLWDSIKNIFVSAFGWIVEKVTGFVNTITKPFKWLRDKIGGLLGWDSSEDIGELDMTADAEALAASVETAATEPAELAAEPISEAAVDAISEGIASSSSAIQDSISAAMTGAVNDTEWHIAADGYDFTVPVGMEMEWGSADSGGFAVSGDTSWGMAGEIPLQYPVVMAGEESASILTAIRDLVSEIAGLIKGGNGGSITIQNLNLPETDDIEDVVSFVKDLREQIGKETA